MAPVEDACDRSDERGGTVRAEEVHPAHVATLAREFARVMRTADLAPGRLRSAAIT